MKAFLWLVLLAIIGVSVYFMFLAMVPAESESLVLMFGNSTETEVELHVELTILKSDQDSFGYADADGAMDWTAWAAAHYIVKDAAGNQVEFTKRKTSNLLPKKEEARGYHDSFLVGNLTKGVFYTFTYIPVVGEPEKYLYEFTAPMDDAGRSRVSFEKI